MPTLKDIVRRLLPRGSYSSEENEASWDICPVWPPDAFAVAATIVSQSGCYAKYRVGAADPDGYRSEVEQAGKDWRDHSRPPDIVKSYWDKLKSNTSELTNDSRVTADWWDPAIRLLAAADEASAGIGFRFSDDGSASDFAKAAHLALGPLTAREDFRERKAIFPYVRRHPYNVRRDPAVGVVCPTLCRWVPPEEACVQPKARTPQVGCTLRSLSHNLALLPPKGEVQASWHMLPFNPGSGHTNLLLVPFPYRIPTSAFHPHHYQDRTGRYFHIDQTWLPPIERRSQEVSLFLKRLIEITKKDGCMVHGIILPEFALDLTTAEQVADSLTTQGLQIFVTGAAKEPHNLVYTCLYHSPDPTIPSDSIITTKWYQAKHHRWMLESNQLSRYGLAHILDPAEKWWEDIYLGERTLAFYSFRFGASFTALVCEDLARIDPSQTLLRAVGPNLVISLLMDGPQLEQRWPGRYATSLADDPGSSVLTLTCLGMVRRDKYAKKEDPWSVGLWKEANGRATPLVLPRGAHGLLITLTCRDEEGVTLDRRSDGCATVQISLSQCLPIAHPNPPDWV